MQDLSGDDISRGLERGICLWDKFLLCASKNSLTSPWVEEEIETTLEKERTLRSERGKKVLKLIPLNLDGYLFSNDWDLVRDTRQRNQVSRRCGLSRLGDRRVQLRRASWSSDTSTAGRRGVAGATAKMSALV